MAGPGHNSGVAAGQLRSIVERIERLKDEQDALAADIREVYAEAKSNGYDKTALGQVVTIRRKRAKDPQAFEERSAMVDLYLAALDGTIDAIARPHAHEDTSEESRERQMSQGPAAIAGTGDRKPEASLQDRIADAPEFASVPAGTAAHHDFDRPPPIPDFLRRDA